MRKTLSSSQSLDESLLQEAAAKAFVPLPTPAPLTGANAVPLTSTPTRGTAPVQSGEAARIVEDDVAMGESSGTPGTPGNF